MCLSEYNNETVLKDLERLASDSTPGGYLKNLISISL
jgi:hypothetical protein